MRNAMLSLWISLLFLFNCVAQPTFFQGTITDAETAYPISYANVFIPATQQGMYANDEGVFQVSLKDAADTDSIFFSHIGYEKSSLTIGQMKAMNGNISMRSNQYSLDEVIITPLAAKELLQLAVRKVKDNYPTAFSKMRMVFKDFSRRSGHRSHFFFFDFDAYLQTYQGEKPVLNTKVNSYEMYDKKREFTASMKPTDLLRVVMLEKSFSDERLKDYEFRYLSNEIYAGEEFDVIGFKGIPTKKNDFISQNGRVFIGKKDREIRYIELSLKNEGSKRFMLVAKMDSLNVLIKVAFKPHDGKYVLDYAVQSTFAKGKLFGKAESLVYSTTAKTIEHKISVSAEDVFQGNEVKEIFDKEKPKDISLMTEDPDMKLK